LIQITFQRIHERFDSTKISNKTKLKSLTLRSRSSGSQKKHLHDAFENKALIKHAPLNASDILNQLPNENDQCEFFANYSQCQILILQSWKSISGNVLRSIAMTMGESLVELDLSSSLINKEHFEILFTSLSSLKILKLSFCPFVNGQCLQLITAVSYRTLIELYVDHCPQFSTIEPLLWISGVVGINSPKLSKLRTLDLSHCPLPDGQGLEAIGRGGLHAIQFLNLEGCESITDHGLISVVSSNHKLRVLNIAGCFLITSKSILALAQSCPQIVSLNLSRCSKISDLAMVALASHSHQLQALNLAGLRSLTEGSIFRILQASPGILMLNVTGCELVTANGLRSMIQGLQFVIEAKTYFGFKPVDEHIERKLMSQLNLIYDTGARKITQAYHQMMNKREHCRLMELVKIDKSARIIQNYLTRYLLRVRFYYKWRARVQFDR
jgi:hypothetical protein